MSYRNDSQPLLAISFAVDLVKFNKNPNSNDFDPDQVKFFPNTLECAACESEITVTCCSSKILNVQKPLMPSTLPINDLPATLDLMAPRVEICYNFLCETIRKFQNACD